MISLSSTEWDLSFPLVTYDSDFCAVLCVIMKTSNLNDPRENSQEEKGKERC